MRQTIAACLAVGLIGTAPPAARAWNNAGHMTVAVFAYRELPDALKAKLITALKAHPYYDLFLTADGPPGVDPNEWVVARALSN